ncbi:Chaperone protein dnaJ C76 [Durusdinium trenchii]|uniref:Chloroplastic (AtDjC76) (AtDjC17) (AtJ17) n=1 Tax=Durusdinium trenchii TaxID=1381693 RepID=A0ABP0R6R4_9DINO
MKICHPDIAGDDGEEICILLNDAYDLLSDPKEKKAYDIELHGANGMPKPVQISVSTLAGEHEWTSKAGNKKMKPVYNGRPLSRSLHRKVPPEDQGEKWNDEKFVFVDEWTCIACRNCCDVAPRTFCIDADAGRARVFAQWGNSEELLDYAVQACPVDCIYWVSRDELQVLEYVTRDRLEDPFTMATDFKAKLEEEAERRKRNQQQGGSYAEEAEEQAPSLEEVERRSTHSAEKLERTVTITGSEDAVDKAARAIEEILSNDRKSLAHQPEHEKDRRVTIHGTAEAVEKASQMIQDIVSRSEEEQNLGKSERGSVIEPPAGFEDCEHEDWLYNATTQEFFSKKTGALAWLNAGIFCPIREGINHQDVQVFSGTAVIGSDQGPAPKTAIIPDLHRVALALKMPFDHVDHPSGMVAAFGSTEAVPVDHAVRGFHEKLLRRISSWRSAWLDQAWFGALTGAILDLVSGSTSGSLPVMGAALLLGRKVIAVSAPGAHVCLMLGSEGCEAVTPMEAQGSLCCFASLPPKGDKNSSVYVAVIADGKGQLEPIEDSKICSAVGLTRQEIGSEKAEIRVLASISVLDGCSTSISSGFPSKEQLNKVRVRQILIRFWSGKGPHPVNPVNRKPVTRRVDEAEMEMLEILEQLIAEKCQNFASLCKSSSECGSALRGGADNGDLGWLDQAKVAALAKAKGQPGGPKSVVQSSVPVAVVKVAFSLEKGELSDVVVSEIGVHLVQRTG